MASSILKLPTLLRCTGVNEDINAIRNGLWWTVVTNATDLPSGNNTSIVLNMVYDENAGVQLCIAATTNKVHARRLLNGTWQAWYQLN